MSEVLLTVSDLSKHYVGVKALAGVSLTINKGEIHALMGENGSGKSTLIKIVAGVEPPDTGEIIFADRHLDTSRAIDSIRAGIGVIYQDLSLYPNLSVAENIGLSHLVDNKVKIINWRELRGRAAGELATIGKEFDLAEKVENLSMANRQIVAIARALSQGAQLIIMDEPTTALTKNEIDLLFSVIFDLKEKGISTLFVSHKLDEVLSISDKVTVIRDGKLIGTFDKDQLDHSKLVFYMTGKTLDESALKQNTISEKPVLLEIKDLSKSEHFRNISFNLRAGEVLGFTGLLGSGRTELALSLYGLNPAESGTILFEGQEITINSTQDAIDMGISYLPEDRVNEGLFEAKPIGDNIIITFLGKLLSPLGLLSSRKAASAIERWARELRIKTPSTEMPVHSLSGGNQQRVVIAKSLAIEPRIFILDNPTVGIDVASKAYIHSVISELAQKKKLGIIIISDDISELLRNCNRILIMKEGRIVDEVTSEHATLEEVYGIVSGTSSNDFAADREEATSREKELGTDGHPSKTPDRSKTFAHKPKSDSNGAKSRYINASDENGTHTSMGLRGFADRLLKKTETYLFLILILFSAFITAVNPSFLTLENMFDLVKMGAVMAILAVGFLIVLLSGGIDVSFAAIAISGQYIAVKTLIALGVSNIFLAFAVSCSVGVFLGFVNGILISKFKLPTLITTLGTMSLFHGSLLTIFGTRAINTTKLPPCFTEFGRMNLIQLTKDGGGTYGLSIFFLVVVIVVVMSWFILRYTILGRGIYAIGGSAESARRTGFSITSIQLFVYCYAGFLAGVMGVVHASLIRFVAPTHIVGSELGVIAAVVLGGASIAGGRGSILGVMIGVTIVTILNTSLVLIGLSSFWNQFFIGLIIIIGIGITSYRNKLQNMKNLTFRVE